MSLSQGYIVGRPTLSSPEQKLRDALSRTGDAVPDTDRRTRVPTRRTDPVDADYHGLFLPAWTARPSIGRWLQAYTVGMRALRRALPTFCEITVTFRSDLSFFDQVAPVLVLARFYGVRTILRYRSNKAEAELEDYGRGVLPFLRLADRLEVGCGYLQRVLARYGLPSDVVPEIIDRNLFRPHQVTEVQPRIVMARRLARGNGITGAVKAFQLVKMKYPRAEMTILGDGPLRAWLERYIETERISGLTLTGPIAHEQVARHMAAADIFISNAAMDGLPASLLEAFASGLCVVATSVGDTPAVINDRRNGLLTPPNDHSRLADRIIELVEDPDLARTLSANAPSSID